MCLLTTQPANYREARLLGRTLAGRTSELERGPEDMTEREAAFADLMRAAARLIAADPEATSFAKRNALCIVAVWPDARHDLNHWPPQDVIRLEP